MPYATALTSLQAQPGPASHENAFPDALELRDAMKMPGSLFEKEKAEKHNWYRKHVRILWKPLLPSTGYHARRVHRAFHVRTLKAVKKIVNRDERRLRAENEEKSTLSIMLTGDV